MGKREERRRAIRQHHLLHESLDVDFVVGKIAHIALARIAQAPRRVPLPAPVDHRHRKTAVAQVPHRLEIFFDVLAAAGEDADGPLAVGRRRPSREAQFGAIGRLDRAGYNVFGNGIGGNRDERHGGRPVRQEAPEIKDPRRQKGSLRAGLNAFGSLPYHLRAGHDQRFRSEPGGRFKGCTTTGPARWRAGSL